MIGLALELELEEVGLELTNASLDEWDESGLSFAPPHPLNPCRSPVTKRNVFAYLSVVNSISGPFKFINDSPELIGAQTATHSGMGVN